MSVLSYSQNSLIKKTQYNNQNAVIISEDLMDSISMTYLRFENVVNEYDLKTSEALKYKAKTDILQSRIDFYVKDIAYQHNQNKILLERIKMAQQIKDAEMALCKQKAKGRFRNLLIGIGIGTLTGVIITSQ